MKSKVLSAVLSLVLAISMVGCGSANSGTGGESNAEQTQPKTKIGILQLVEHGALDASREGFIQALEDNGYKQGENLEIDYQNAQGDQSNLLTMSQRLVNNKSDLVLAIATGAAQALASQTKEIPIVFTAVTDPLGAGLVNSNELPGGNISGTNDMSPIQEQIELLLQLCPEVKTIGIAYCSSEDNSITQAKEVKAIVEALGLEWVEQTVTTSNDVQQITQSLVSKCDAIYIPTDNVYASAMGIVEGVVKESKTPVICGEINMVAAGGLATLGLNYYNLGYQTGEMAVRALKGEDVSKMPVESLVKYDYYINGDMATAIGVEIPKELQQYIQ